MISIRGGSGLGDALYVQSVARHFVEQGERVEACCAWPDVFASLGDAVTISPFRRDRINVLAHYASRRGFGESTQWEDVCLTAGIPATTPLRLDWRVRGHLGKLVDEVVNQAGSLPIALIQMPRAPFARKDGYGIELLPNCKAIQHAIDALDGVAFRVQVGAGDCLHRFDSIDLDLANRTTVPDLIDLASVSACVVGYASYIVPLAESLELPGLIVWARAGRHSRHEPVRQITPRKVIHRKDLLNSIWDDEHPPTIAMAANALCGSVERCQAA